MLPLIFIHYIRVFVLSECNLSLLLPILLSFTFWYYFMLSLLWYLVCTLMVFMLVFMYISVVCFFTQEILLFEKRSMCILNKCFFSVLVHFLQNRHLRSKAIKSKCSFGDVLHEDPEGFIIKHLPDKGELDSSFCNMQWRPSALQKI